MRPKQKVNAILHLPSSPQAVLQFEEKMCNFYIKQVEKQLHTYDIKKEQKLEVINLLISEYNAFHK